MEKIARGRSREANIAQGKQQCFNWFIVLASLFEQIGKILLGAIEWQSTRKVRSLALADHSKAVCLC